MSDVRPPTPDAPPPDEPRPGVMATVYRWIMATVTGEEVPGVQRGEATPPVEAPPEPPTLDKPEPHHPSVKYERTDTGFRWVLVTAAVLVVFGCIESGMIYVFFRHQEKTQAEAKRSPYPLAEQPTDQLPAQPRLEPLDRTPPGELAALARREADKNRQLRRYGTTDDDGFVRIPIARAIESLAGKLPVRDTREESVRDRGLVDSGEPNSGRLLRGGAE